MFLVLELTQLTLYSAHCTCSARAYPYSVTSVRAYCIVLELTHIVLLVLELTQRYIVLLVLELTQRYIVLLVLELTQRQLA